MRRGLSAHRHPDLQVLDVGGVRHGTDITVELGTGHRIRLLAVHLKSGCFDKPLSTPGNACQKLAAQLPVLEQWIDARATEGTPSMVLGDFNRRLFAGTVAGDEFWQELDDGQPPQADLDSPTDNRSARCWNGKYPKFIDHLVYDRAAAALVVPGSFEQHLYDAADAAHARVLSDHCPLSLRLSAKGGGAPSAEAPSDPAVAAEPAAGAPPAIKGNISRDGRRLYHLPECPSYAATRISEDKGERWFAAEAQAREAGWEKASNCP